MLGGAVCHILFVRLSVLFFGYAVHIHGGSFLWLGKTGALCYSWDGGAASATCSQAACRVAVVGNIGALAA